MVIGAAGFFEILVLLMGAGVAGTAAIPACHTCSVPPCIMRTRLNPANE